MDHRNRIFTVLMFVASSNMLSPPLVAEEWGGVVNGLQCHLSANTWAWHSRSDLRFKIEMRNVSEAVQIIPIDICSQQPWAGYVAVCFQSGGDERVCVGAAPLRHSEVLHPHSPHEISPHEIDRYEVKLTDLHETLSRLPAASKLLSMMDRGDPVRVWAEFPRVVRKWKSKRLPWMGANSHHRLWEGKLVSNRLSIFKSPVLDQRNLRP